MDFLLAKKYGGGVLTDIGWTFRFENARAFTGRPGEEYICKK